MDQPLAIQEAFTLVSSIKTWLDVQEPSEREPIILSISTTINRVFEILNPICGNNDTTSAQKLCVTQMLDRPSETAAANGLRAVLTRTKEHLIAWGRKKPTLKGFSGVLVFFGPGQILNALKQDDADLNNLLISMLLSFTVNNLLRESLSRESATSPDSSRRSSPTGQKAIGEAVQSISLRNPEVSRFWKEYIGLKLSWAPKDAFHHSLSQYLDYPLPKEAYDRMILAFDEYNIGGVTPSALDRLVGEAGTLQTFVDTFMDYDRLRQWYVNIDSLVTLVNETDPVLAGDGIHAPSSFPLPLLLWIDDNPENVIHSMRFAESIGVHVISITSTHDAKRWIDDNLDFLKANNTGSRVRGISDNARIEFDPSLAPPSQHQSQSHLQSQTQSAPTSTSAYNFSAGESIIRYIRGHLLTRIPILICCGGSIPYTHYVERYALCGSTVSMRIAEEFVKALKEGRVDDDEWRRWDAGWVG